MKEQIKKTTAIVLIITMMVANNGMMVLASGVEGTIGRFTSVEKEVPNYYYGEVKTVDSYKEYLEEGNPDIFNNKKETDEKDNKTLDNTNEDENEQKSSEKEETKNIEEKNNKPNEEENENIEENENKEKENEETTGAEKDVSINDEKNEKENINESEEKEIEEVKEYDIEENEEISTNSEVNEEHENKADLKRENSKEQENEDEENIKKATTSETSNKESLDEEKKASKSEIDDILATNSQIEIKVSSDSEIEKSIASISELSGGRERIVATVSKVSWKVKNILIATYSVVNTESKETDDERVSRLATYANVIVESDKGEEKVFKVNLGWKLYKEYEVNARSGKKERPIPKEVWRDNLKVDEFIKKQDKEVIIATSNFAKVEEKIREENEKYEDKEYVVRFGDESDYYEEKAKENIVKTRRENVKIKISSESEVSNNVNATKSDIEEIKVDDEIEYVENNLLGNNLVEDEMIENLNITESKATTSDIAIDQVDEENDLEKAETKETEISEEAVIEEEINKEDKEVTTEEEIIATPTEINKVELTVDGMNTNGKEIADDIISYYDLQKIYIYKVDMQNLGDEIIGLINNLNEESKSEESDDVSDKNKKDTSDEEINDSVIGGILKVFGIELNSSDEESNSEEDDSKDIIEVNVEDTEIDELTNYLLMAKVDVVEESVLSPVFAEIDTHLLGAGATHTQHTISSNVNGEILKSDNIFDATIGGEGKDMLDLSSSNERVKATDSGIVIEGAYYLPSDIKITNKWMVESGKTLALCLNGHNVVFATAGYIKAEGRVTVCNCGGKSTITTQGPQYNWKDKWYATTSETYTKWNEKSLFAGKEVGVYAKDNNITFSDITIKNQYNGRQVALYMEDTEKDEAEYSGDGSILWGKNKLQVYGVTFTNNKATRSNGVAANAQLGEMILENCTFTSNRNLTNKGGAVAFNPKSTIIHNCTFKNNISFTNGGALYGKSYKDSRESAEIGTKITKTSFENNAALVSGGAIFMDYLCKEGVTIDGTAENKIVFKNNYAGVSGGAIAVNHIRSVEGEKETDYSYEDNTNLDRLLNINYATFEKNAAKGIKINKDTGAVTDNNDSTRENYGGAIYLNARTVNYETHATDAPIKMANINNCKFDQNVAKGLLVEIKAKDETGAYTGPVLAKYNLSNYGGAIYADKLTSINIKDTVFDKNESITGASICVKETKLDISGGELSNGKAYNSQYSATEFYKNIVSPGGGAIYIMKDASVTIADDTEIKSNENAFYLDGGTIDLASKKVSSNIGEYLIGYTNYKTNKILFSGVDIREHEFNETRKDYSSTLSDASVGERHYENGIYAPSYISFKGTNLINFNKRNYYTKSGGTYVKKLEDANIVMTSFESNLQFDLSNYLFDVPFSDFEIDDRIGLYYDFDPSVSDDILVFDKWNESSVKVISEGGLWTNYFEIDNSSSGKWAENWRFYIKNNEIRMDSNIVKVNFDSYIDDVPKIKPQFYHITETESGKVRIATPTEIVRNDIKTPGRKLLGFLGVDKTEDANEKYAAWDFNRCVIDTKNAKNNEVTIVLVYTNDSIKIKPCGCENGITCMHNSIDSKHTDRGLGDSISSAKYLNYVEVATCAQFAYRYEGKKTQYALSKDLKISATQANEFINGGIVLNLNGKTLTYDTLENNNSYILTTANTDTFNSESDAKVMICGIATPGSSKRGSIVANGSHKGAFIIGDKDIYLSKLDIKNVVATSDSNKGFIHSDTDAINSYINLYDVTFSNINLKSDLINGSKVILEKSKIENTTLSGSVIKLKANASADTMFSLLSSEVINLPKAGALLSASTVSPATGTKVLIATSSITSNEFETQCISLKNDINGSNSSISLQGDVNIKGNKLISGSSFIYNDASNGDDKFGITTSDNIVITENILPHVDNTTLLGLYEKAVTFKGNITISDNKTTASGKATNKVSAVKSGNNTIAYLDEVAMQVTNNDTLYNWYAVNNNGTTQTSDKTIFTQVVGTKLRASASEIKISLQDNSGEQIVYDNWSIDKIIGEKEAEATFIRDDSYTEDETYDIYKKGKTDRDSDIYFGTGYVDVVFRIYNYREGIDERTDTSIGYAKAITQKVEPDVYTLLDTPQYKIDTTEVSVMWEAFAYKNSDGTYDYSRERLYPRNTKNIGIKTNVEALVSGYIYNNNGITHSHGGVELWTEARNEGHLQATNSYIYLHNDVEITHPLLFVPDKDYYLCLNGYKLIINTDTSWFKSSTCNLIITDCKKSGSIVQNSGSITKDIIEVNGGKLTIKDVDIGPFSNVENNSFVKVSENVDVVINNVEVKNIIMKNTISGNKSFIDITTRNKASISNIKLLNNKMLSNGTKKSIFAINNTLNEGNMVVNGFEVKDNEVSADAANSFDGDGYILRINGYESVTFESTAITGNKSVLGSPIEIIGNGVATSVLNMKNTTYMNNQKNYVGTMAFDYQLRNGISANFATTGFKKLNITGGTFKGNRFNAGSSILAENEGAVIDFVNYESALLVKDVAFDGTGTSPTERQYGIVILDRADDVFENVTFENYNIGNSIYMNIAKGSANSPAGTTIGKVTFKGDTKFTGNKALSVVSVDNIRSDTSNENEGMILFDRIPFTNNVMPERTETLIPGLIKLNSDVVMIVTGSNITKTTSTALYVNNGEARLLNVEINEGLGNSAAVYVDRTGKLAIGDKVVVKGNATNIYLAGDATSNAKIKVIEGHPILKTTDISLSAANIELNFFDYWGENYIENYNHYKREDYAYLPSDLFKLDSAIASNRVIYKEGSIEGGNQKLWISSTTTNNYATLVFYDEEVQGKKEILKQYIAVDKTTKLDRVQVDYVSTYSQIWMVESDGNIKDAQENWTLYSAGAFNDFEVKNYKKGITYYAYLTRKHIHKICGLYTSVPCGPNHIDGVSHTEELVFEQIVSNETIIYKASKSNYLGLTNDLVITQEALNSMTNRDIVFCLSGYTLSFAENATLNTNYNFTFVNCENTGAITVANTKKTTNTLINVGGTDKTFSLYNIKFDNFETQAEVVIMRNVKLVSENTVFTRIKSSANNGLCDMQSITAYIKDMSYTNNNIVGDLLLDIKFGTFTIGRIENIKIQDNTYTSKLLSFSGEGNADFVAVGSNKVESGASNTYGAIYVANGANITYTNSVKLSSNDTSAKDGAKGGALTIYGQVNFNDNVVFESNKSKLGGGIYLAEGGKVIANREMKFTGNSATKGAAIYAEKLTAGDLTVSKYLFNNDIADEEGNAIAFGGELNLTNAEIKDGKGGQTYISNINKDSSLDKANISSISFIGNNINSSAITLVNVRDGTIVEEIVSKNNTFAGLIEYKNISEGNKVKIKNLLNTTGNTFKNAGIVFENVKAADIENIDIKNNTSATYGMMLIKGADTKVKSIGSLIYQGNTNSGNYGAAITILDKAVFEEDGGMLITGNKSTNGGAIYLDGTLGVKAEDSKELKVSANYINNTSQTKNIYVTNVDSYVYALGKLSDNTTLGFTAGDVNVTVFKYWNSSYIEKIGNTDKFTYTPENCGLFVVDTLSQNAKQEFYKSGAGDETVVKLGANFTKLRFVSAGRTTEYLTQNIERNVETKLDKVLVMDTNEKWIAPNNSREADYKWDFNTGNVLAKYDSATEYIYKLFTYSIVYTAGSKTGTKTYDNIEYGQVVTADENTFEGKDFTAWYLRNEIAGQPKVYKPGDSIKNICLTDGGTAYLDARWGDEIIIKFDPNSTLYGLSIAYDSKYEIIGKAGKSVSLNRTYPFELGGQYYKGYTYNTMSNGAGIEYKIGNSAVFNEDTTIYLMWIEKGGGNSGSGGARNGGTYTGASIYEAAGDKKNVIIAPGTNRGSDEKKIADGFVLYDDGSIRDRAENIVGSIYLGDRVNADGSFTAQNGITVYTNGTIIDVFGNTYNTDGSIKTMNGVTYFTNGDVKDAQGIIYHIDGSKTFPDGTIKDSDGIIHYPDGSITLADGTTYFIDGTILSPGGIRMDENGQIIDSVQANSINGNWKYDPKSDNWQYEKTNIDGSITLYKDQWINSKNAQGNNAWYVVDKDGNMVTGWIKDKGEYYYMSESPNTKGELVKGRQKIREIDYEFDNETGALISGSVPKTDLTVIGAENHTSGKDGVWRVYNNGKRYYVSYVNSEDGTRKEELPKEWYMIDGDYYYFDEQGVPKTGLVEFDKKYYYFNEDGTMKEGGEVVIDDKIYVFDKATGVCKTIRLK